MPECQSCGGFVTKDFQRVFGARDGDVYACLECEEKAAIKNGAASTKP